jgi:small-conductance mechanosensitive channel
MGYVDGTKLSSWLPSGVAEIDVHALFMRAVSSLVLFVSLLVLRWIVGSAIRRQERIPRDVRRRMLVQVRNGVVLLFLLGLVVIWATELRTVAVYLFAIAVATVIATKELIQCFTGSIMRAAGGTFTIGDRIEIGDFRGDVIDMGLLTTTIMEIGPNELTHRLTGRAVTLPNSVFLSKPVVNESYTDQFVLHVFTVPVKVADDWQQVEQDLLTAAGEQGKTYLEEARRHFNKISSKEGLVVLSVEPHVTVNVSKPDELDLVVRLATPARKKGQIQQAVVRRFLELRSERLKRNVTDTKEASAASAVDTTGGDTDWSV